MEVLAVLVAAGEVLVLYKGLAEQESFTFSTRRHYEHIYLQQFIFHRLPIRSEVTTNPNL
jgi:hypothetical protein